MEFPVSLAGRGDRSARIYRQLHEAILDGRLRPGERLAPTRELATRLGVSRNTVALAYERLTAEGFLVARVGAGTFVCAEPPGPGPARRRAPGGAVTARQIWRTLADAGPPDPQQAVRYDFRVGMPDASLFPLQTWRRLVAGQLRMMHVPAAGYGDPRGHADLRGQIARHVGLSRSVRAGEDDIIVTQGAQQALDLIGRVLVAPGDVVAVEEPGYPPARLAFAAHGARVVGVPVDGEGVDVAAIPRGTRLVYTTPSHQFPLGTAMSLARRGALLEWARRGGAVIVEDDYDSEFRFSDRPLEPLQSLDRDGRVIYVGSFSKTMLPMLRLGFLVAPASLRAELGTAKWLTDRQGEITTQGALARFLADGMLSRHIRRCAKEYAARHELLTATLRRDFADRLDIVPATAGMHLAALVRPDAAGMTGDRVRDAARVDRIVRDAAATGIAVDRLAGYYADGPGRPGLVFGYGSIPLGRIEPGLRALSDRWLR